ncbi:hypothetical protein FACS1894208_12860 [Clostridia bacterium]|nr:hypothetical protein FACS1894208_12860 [Clostridia bacterium]
MSVLKKPAVKIVLTALAGLAAAVIYDLLNMRDFRTQSYHDWSRYSFLGLFLQMYAGWAVIECVISYKSKTPVRAAVYCFVFTLFSQPGERIFEWAFSGFSNYTPFHDIWYYVIASFLTAPCGWLVWHVRKKSVLGGVAAAVPALGILIFGVTSFLAANRPVMWHFPSESGSGLFSAKEIPATLYTRINYVAVGLIFVGFAVWWVSVFLRKPKDKPAAEVL